MDRLIASGNVVRVQQAPRAAHEEDQPERHAAVHGVRVRRLPRLVPRLREGCWTVRTSLGGLAADSKRLRDLLFLT